MKCVKISCVLVLDVIEDFRLWRRQDGCHRLKFSTNAAPELTKNKLIFHLIMPNMYIWKQVSEPDIARLSQDQICGC